uniref:Senescence-associated protein n=1 Tax=Parascaris univalens TaxID=6257 RepID=A0A915CE44_PARUN
MVASHHWPIGQAQNQMSEPAVPLVLSRITIATTSHSRVKLHVSRRSKPAHVPYWWVNNPTLGEFCFAMIGRADIEGSKSNVAMDAWLPQASYPCGNFSDTSC